MGRRIWPSGPDGNYYFSVYGAGILRFDSQTGQFIDVFVSPGSGSIGNPDGLTFGPDGNLYVSQGQNSLLVKFDGQTGALFGYVAWADGNIQTPRDVQFGPDGGIYVAESYYDNVLKYNPVDNSFQGVFVTAGDGGLDMPTDLLFVPDVNQPPVAVVSPQQNANEGDTVILDGTGSYDPEGENLTYQWSQTDGPQVNLIDSDTATPSFIAPVTGSNQQYVYELLVSDGTNWSAPETVTVSVMISNHPPVADAGGDKTVNEGDTVLLDGTSSYDPDGNYLGYSWWQISGPSPII